MTKDESPSTFRIADVRVLINILMAMKSGSKQLCIMQITETGVTFRWEDDSKSLQSAIFLRPEIFIEYNCPANTTHVTGLKLDPLITALQVFSTSEANDVSFSYPGPDSELTMSASVDIGSNNMNVYSKLSAEVFTSPPDLAEVWSEPSSIFIAPGQLLKEAVEDLEWPESSGKGVATLSMLRDPRLVSFTATGSNGILTIEMPNVELSGFNCTAQRVSHSYKFRHLKTAFCQIPSSSGGGFGGGQHGSTVRSKVAMDGNGLLKVLHMVEASGLQGGRKQQPVRLEGDAGTIETSRVTAMSGSKSCVVQFLILPQDVRPGDDE